MITEKKKKKRKEKKRNVTEHCTALTDVTWQRANFNKEKNLCNTTVHVYSDIRSENSFLAGSEKGCEKVKKPQRRIKTEPYGVEMHEGNF